jgi:hypothetical protein
MRHFTKPPSDQRSGNSGHGHWSSPAPPYQPKGPEIFQWMMGNQKAGPG